MIKKNENRLKISNKRIFSDMSTGGNKLSSNDSILSSQIEENDAKRQILSKFPRFAKPSSGLLSSIVNGKVTSTHLPKNSNGSKVDASQTSSPEITQIGSSFIKKLQNIQSDRQNSK
jgi:hypothetical protein